VVLPKGVDLHRRERVAMIKDKRDRLKKKLQREGFDVEDYDDYSGRGMFGQRTFALVVEPAASGFVGRNKVDNLGLQVVVY
jgi:hypothetical protein